MPLLKRKPVLMHPLPSLSSIVQLVGAPAPSAQDESPSAGPGSATPGDKFLQDSSNDEEQLNKLMAALQDPTLCAPLPKKPRGSTQANGALNGAGQPPPAPGPVPGYRVKNVDCFIIPETGEIFLDYEWVHAIMSQAD